MSIKQTPELARCRDETWYLAEEALGATLMSHSYLMRRIRHHPHSSQRKVLAGSDGDNDAALWCVSMSMFITKVMQPRIMDLPTMRAARSVSTSKSTESLGLRQKVSRADFRLVPRHLG